MYWTQSRLEASWSTGQTFTTYGGCDAVLLPQTRDSSGVLVTSDEQGHLLLPWSPQKSQQHFMGKITDAEVKKGTPLLGRAQDWDHGGATQHLYFLDFPETKLPILHPPIPARVTGKKIHLMRWSMGECLTANLQEAAGFRLPKFLKN